jgi:inositol oxygenase
MGRTSASAENKKEDNYRDYTATTKKVRGNYKQNHRNQTFEWVLEQKEKFSKCDSGLQLSIWEAAEKLNDVVDDSDPDTSLPQIEHLLQTAEAARKAYPGEEYDWLHLIGFIHDLGKLLAHKELFDQPQWAVVGDTYPVGCPFDPKVVFHEFFAASPDWNKPEYSTGLGVYSPGCGFNNVHMSWGHDEYMYQVCVKNGTTLPEKALYIIRFHSFYALHQAGAYKELMDATDEKMLKWLKVFQKCDLYSKCETRMDVEQLKPYYQGLIEKYFPPVLNW